MPIGCRRPVPVIRVRVAMAIWPLPIGGVLLWNGLFLLFAGAARKIADLRHLFGASATRDTCCVAPDLAAWLAHRRMKILKHKVTQPDLMRSPQMALGNAAGFARAGAPRPAAHPMKRGWLVTESAGRKPATTAAIGDQRALAQPVRCRRRQPPVSDVMTASPRHGAMSMAVTG